MEETAITEKTKPELKPKRAERIIAVDGYRGFYSQFGYHSARVANKEGRSAVQATGSRHELYDREKLIAQSRQFMRDNAIYTGMIERAVSYIIGPGFTLQVRTADSGWNTAAETLWKEYWKKPEIRGLLSGLQVEQMLCSELFVAGDVGIIKVDGGAIQLIEAEQIIGKTKRSGVNLTKLGAISSFSVCPYSESGFVESAKATLYKPADFLFMVDPKRPSSIRSVPPCQAAFPMLHRINDVCDSEAIAWQMLSRFAVAVEQAGAAEAAFGTSVEDTTKTTTQGRLTTRLHELDYALAFFGEPGEKITGIERNIPGQNFSEALRMFLRLVGLPLGFPLEFILLDWTQSNYSQSRAVNEQAYRCTFLKWQKLLDAAGLSQIYLWKLGQWVAEKELTKRDDMLKYEWFKPAAPWIDQEKEATATGLKIDRGLTTHSQELKSLNLDRDEVVAARDREVRDAIEVAQKIKADTGEDVSWQIFAGMRPPQTEPGRPGGQTPAMQKDEQQKQEGD